MQVTTRPFQRHLIARLVAAACLPLVAGLVLAQPATATGPSATAAQPVFAIRGFEIQGENPLETGETSRLLAPFLRTQATIETLAAATAALEQALKAGGHALHRVVLPPQPLGETVRLQIVRFALDKVDVKGLSRLDRENVLASLPELAPGGSPNLQRMAIQGRLANLGGHKQVQVGLKASAKPDAIDATVDVREGSPWQWGVDLSNTGSAATGRDRLTLLGGHSNLFNRDHALSGAWTTSLQEPGDVRQWGLTYRMPLYASGGFLQASLSRSDIVGRFGAFSSTGAGDSLVVGYTRYLPQADGFTSEWSLGVADRLFKGAQILGAGGVPLPGTASPDTRGRSAVFGFSGRQDSDTRPWAYGLQLAVSLPGGRGNTLAAYSNGGLNPAITSHRWLALRGNASLRQTLAGGWHAGLRTEWQFSPDALIAGEQFGFGGASSLRGMKERALSGDQGLFGSAEVVSPPLGKGLRALAFLDAGVLHNHNPNASRLASDRVSSVGLGLRWSPEPQVSLNLDYGRIVTGSRLPAAGFPDAPRKGDERLHLMLSVRY